PGLADHLEAVLLEQPHHALPQEDRIVSHNYAHGIRALSVVPRPRSESISSLPSSTAIRSARPLRPVPLSGSAPPTPSSVTSTTRRPFRRSTPTVAGVAFAYF